MQGLKREASRLTKEERRRSNLPGQCCRMSGAADLQQLSCNAQRSKSISAAEAETIPGDGVVRGRVEVAAKSEMSSPGANVCDALEGPIGKRPRSPVRGVTVSGKADKQCRRIARLVIR